MGSAGWYFLYSPTFQVHQVEIRGLNPEKQAWLKADELLVGSNIFRLPTVGLAERLQDIPGVAEYQVVRILPRKVAVVVREREPVLKWQTGNDYWLVDQEGRAYQQVGAEANSDLPLVYDTANIAVESQARVAPLILIRTVSLINERLPSLEPSGVKSYELGETVFDLDVITNSGKRLRFNALGDTGRQLEDAARLAAQRPDLFARQYIDLRVDRWAYVK